MYNNLTAMLRSHPKQYNPELSPFKMVYFRSTCLHQNTWSNNSILCSQTSRILFQTYGVIGRKNIFKLPSVIHRKYAETSMTTSMYLKKKRCRNSIYIERQKSLIKICYVSKLSGGKVGDGCDFFLITLSFINEFAHYCNGIVRIF